MKANHTWKFFNGNPDCFFLRFKRIFSPNLQESNFISKYLFYFIFYYYLKIIFKLLNQYKILFFILLGKMHV